ncbi:uncharacterized protein [Argopecten irradians]|uniref:uncharacterized protein n=1 Tax=Argopecten irradians TaxID=31199 RepID=UPI003713D4CE
MDYLRVAPTCFRLLLIVVTVLILYSPCCRGSVSGRAAVSSKNRIHKVSSSIMTSSKGSIIQKTKRPPEVVHRTKIVPSSRATSCLKLQCPVSTPKSCRYLTVVLLSGGKRCRQCTIKRSRKCRISKPTKTIFTPTKKVFKPTKKVFKPTKKVFKPAKKVFKPAKKVLKPAKKVLPRKIKTISNSSRITPAQKSRNVSSARIKQAAIRKRTRAKLNNFEGRWVKGFSSD